MTTATKTKRNEPVEVMAEHEGRSFSVRFEFEWHDPPLPGAYHDRRVRQTTTCSVTGPSQQLVQGFAHCSVADRYKFMTGCRRALSDAVFVLRSVDSAPEKGAEVVEWLRQRERAFARQVLPVLAADPRARVRRTPPMGARAARRRLGEAVDTMRFIAHALTMGPDAATELRLVRQSLRRLDRFARAVGGRLPSLVVKWDDQKRRWSDEDENAPGASEV